MLAAVIQEAPAWTFTSRRVVLPFAENVERLFLGGILEQSCTPLREGPCGDLAPGRRRRCCLARQQLAAEQLEHGQR